MAEPTLHDQGVVRVTGAAPTRVQGRPALYSNQTRWPTPAGDILGPFYLFSFVARSGKSWRTGYAGPQLYLYMRANDTWYLDVTGIHDAYMREWVDRVGWGYPGVVSQEALQAMGLDLRDRVGRALAGHLAQGERAAEVAAESSTAQRQAPSNGSVPSSGGGGGGGGGASAPTTPAWLVPAGVVGALGLGVYWWRGR